MEKTEKKYKIYYLCLSPKLSLKNKSYSSVVHITETINAFRKKGHYVLTNLKEYSEKDSDNKIVNKSNGEKTKLFFFPAFLKYFLRDVYLILYNFKWYFRIKKKIALEHPSFIYERITDFSFAPYLASRKSNTPIIIESNAPPEEQKNSKTNSIIFFINKWLNIYVIKRCSLLITVSSSLLEYYKNNTDRSKFSYYLPNGVNLENFNFELNNGIQIKNSLGIDSEIVIGFIGNVRPYHQTDILIDVAKKIVNEVKNFRIFMLTGDDKNKDLFLEKIHEQKLDKYFIFYKSVNNDEIPEIIKIMDICVLPGFSWYGSPMKIFEYAAMKKPIVGPDIPPLTDVFINGKSVLLTEKNNSVDIAEKIIYLFKNPESRKLLGENAYNTVKENNTWTRNIEKILVHYEDFISAKIN